MDRHISATAKTNESLATITMNNNKRKRTCNDEIDHHKEQNQVVGLLSNNDDNVEDNKSSSKLTSISSSNNSNVNIKKRKLPPSNFSIESIMKQTETSEQVLLAEEEKLSLNKSSLDILVEEDKDQDSEVENEDDEEEEDEEDCVVSPISPTPSSFSGDSSDVALSTSSEDSSNGDTSVAGGHINDSSTTKANSMPNSTLKSNSAGGPNKKNSSGSSNHLLKQQVCHDPRLKPFECQLDNLDLWHRFHPLDTEMIITKQGRRMFPPVRVTFSLGDTGIIAGGRAGQTANQSQTIQSTTQTTGQTLQLNPRDKYQVLMDILPYDNKRYRYAYHKSSWQQAGKADPPSPTKLFLHPDGPFTLEQLKRQVISFEKIKLTNNDANKHGFIVLNSMHKYQPRIHLALWRGKESQNLANAPISHLEQETYKTFIFSETIFTAVTAYQNHSITKLKIDSNPFAKGFRDSSRLTDLELESMQDLISDGQCPFSPPRPQNHPFPHFLFANHHQAPPGSQLGEDPLLGERTMRALNSFLQQQASQHNHHLGQPPPSSQQQQQQQQQQPPQQVPPNSHQPSQHQSHDNVDRISDSMSTNHPQLPLAFQPFNSFFGLGAFPPTLTHNPHQAQLSSALGVPTSQATNLTSSSNNNQKSNLEQLIMQQQQQFAAAMAAAGGNHPLQSLFGIGSSILQPQGHLNQAPPPPPPPPAPPASLPPHSQAPTSYNSLYNNQQHSGLNYAPAPSSQSQLQQSLGQQTRSTKTSGTPASEQSNSSPVTSCQISPSSSVTKEKQQQQVSQLMVGNLNFNLSPHGGASSLYSTATRLAAMQHQQPKHFEAMLSQQHHQMATAASLAASRDNHQVRPDARDYDAELSFLIKNYAEKTK